MVCWTKYWHLNGYVIILKPLGVILIASLFLVNPLAPCPFVGHLASPLSKGLFAGAIMDSGTCDSSLGFRSLKNATSFSRLYAKTHNCNTTSGPELLKCLRAMKPYDLMAWNNISGQPGYHPKLYPLMHWIPVIDGVALPDLPLSLLEKGTFNQVPLIIGTNHDEGSAFVLAAPLVVRGFKFPVDAKMFDLALNHFFLPESVSQIKKNIQVRADDYEKMTCSNPPRIFF
eukprot:TRINITY_DN2020_c0_g1_i1.p1 TRINITY_DN2020_c0_g1~~TRINITY_DN2020_c0_g1_i1.p1  ORF type:complete len:229 (+),score=18.26 TRINITY_DN2020_c0_g1_i1:446-1132(+)